MFALLLSFFVSLMVTFLVIRYESLHRHFSMDNDVSGIQKFHAVAVPRIGGLGVLVGAFTATLAIIFLESERDYFGLIVLLCGLFAFTAGFIEDLTKKVGVRERLIATAISGLAGALLLGGWLTKLDVPWFDYVMTFTPVSILVTCIAICGVANSYNIIDGFNGLAGVVASVALLGLAYVAIQVGDNQIVMISLSMVGAITGFLVWNFPRGLIFLGDGGAYLIGFMIAELSVLLVVRNPIVSPWFPLLLSFYPIFETIFSIYRKKVKRGISPGVPDGLHLHMLIFKRVVRFRADAICLKQRAIRNSMTSPYLWFLSSFATIPSLIFWDDSLILMMFTVLFALLYLFIYKKIVRMKIPAWILLKWDLKKEGEI